MELKANKLVARDSKIYWILIASWFISNVLFPGAFGVFKIILTSILCLLSFIELSFFKLSFNKKLITGIFIFLGFTITSLCIGTINHFSLDFSVIEVYVLRPILLFFIVTLSEHKMTLENFRILLNITYSALVVYNFLYMLGSFGVIPNFFSWEVQNVVIQSEDFLASRLTNQVGLIFLFPYYSFCIFKSDTSKTFITYLMFALGLLVSLISGRRILQIIAILTVIMIPFLKKNRTLKSFFRFYISIFIVILAAFFIDLILSSILNIDSFFDTVRLTILNAFDSQAYSSIIRTNQIEVLLDEWKNHFFIGSGLNSYVKSFVRSTTTPWSYEFVYIGYLFQTGIIGALILISFVFRILIKLLSNKVNQCETIFFSGIFVGAISFIIAGATNPMIASMWFWFILLFAFVLLCKKEMEIKNEK